jgi:hypothetical protein
MRFMQSYRTVTHAVSGHTFATPNLYYANLLMTQQYEAFIRIGGVRDLGQIVLFKKRKP